MRYVVRAIVVLAILYSVPNAETLEEYLAAEIIRDYDLDSAFVSISILRNSLPPLNVSEYDVKAYPLTQAEPSGRFPMRVELYRAGEMVERGSVSLDVRRYADLLVPVQNIKRHEPLRPDMFEFKRFEVTSFSDIMLSDPSQLEGCRAAQNLQAGKYVSTRRIERIPDVEYNSSVTIVGKGRLFEIRARGTALENGIIGESVRVKNDDSKKILTGTVTGPGVVEIDI